MILVFALFCFVVGCWNGVIWINTGSTVHFIAIIAMAICTWVNLKRWWRFR